MQPTRRCSSMRPAAQTIHQRPRTSHIQTGAPVWMWLVLGLWWIVCAAGLIELQRRVGCIDTYQAIWGLDPALPGYRHRPIGIGITRFTESSATDAPWQKASSK